MTEIGPERSRNSAGQPSSRQIRAEPGHGYPEGAVRDERRAADQQEPVRRALHLCGARPR